MQVIKDHLLQIGLYFLHLSEDHTSLPLDLCLTQRAVLDDISQDLYSWRGSRVKTLPKGGYVLFYLCPAVLYLGEDLSRKLWRNTQFALGKCRRSGEPPCSRSPTPNPAESVSWCPVAHMYMHSWVNKPQDVFCIIESSSHLKCHMFQEVCCAIISLILIATASIYPEAHLQKDGCEYPHVNTNSNTSIACM